MVDALQVPSDDFWQLIIPFWGKARPSDGTVPPTHPCICHCLDVAAVADALIASRPEILGRIAADLGWDEEETRAVLLFLMTLHDIGKFSRSFQAIVPEYWPSAVLGELKINPPRNPRHTVAGHYLLDRLLPESQPFEGWKPRSLRMLTAPFTGHHGRPVDLPPSIIEDQVFGRACLQAASRHVEIARRLFAVPKSLTQPTRQALSSTSWTMAGLVVLADWIGSNQRWFPYYDPSEEMSPRSYFADRQSRAARALDEVGLAPPRVSRKTGYRALTGEEHEPSPAQAWAEQVVLDNGPQLVLIEDMTGSGKTEAALIVAHRMMAAGMASGLFVALPTMATADALYARLERVYRRLFAEDATPSLCLAHGAASLHDAFKKTVLPIAQDERASEAEEDQESDRSGAACAAWLADSRRKVFLADVGVGTIDQAFLAVLPARYQSLRLFGLADRVLVVDEAHAYDAYMGKELERLLEFHAGLGGSAVVLSATLPRRQRQALVDAFSRGSDQQAKTLHQAAYPLVTTVSRSGVFETALSTRADLPRQLHVSRCPSSSAAIGRIQEALAAGAAIAWIRNSVDDVLDAAEALDGLGIDAQIFHARFAMGDRLARERDVVERFGKSSLDDKRAGVLVATQVIEQSLDLDFDLLISDLAPIDLLLQRAGRLWRHSGRKRPVDGPELLVISPEPVEEPADDWYQSAFPRGAYVYPDHALLWHTARMLFSKHTWSVPADVRTLIEDVYRPIEDDEVPSGLEERHWAAAGRANADGSVAAGNLLDLSKGYGSGHAAWDSDVRTPTRIGDETRRLRLAKIVGKELRPWCEAQDGDDRRSWALSEVKVRASKAESVLMPTELEPVAKAVRSVWSRYDDDVLLLPLIETEGGGFRGEVVDAKGQRQDLSYTEMSGLRFRESA